MNAQQRTADLFEEAKKRGLINPVTEDAAPTFGMVLQAIKDAERFDSESQELATYLKRMVRIVRKTDPENKIAASAVEFMRCIGYTNPLR